MRAQKLPYVAHHPLANQIIVTEETHRQQAVGQAGAGVEAERRQRVAHPVEQGIGSRIAQQSADPGRSATLESSPSCSCRRSTSSGSSSTHTSSRLLRVPWLKVSPITGRPRQSRSSQQPAGGAKMKGSEQPGIGPGKKMASCGSHLWLPAGQGSTAGELALARRCCGKTCWRRAWLSAYGSRGQVRANCQLITADDAAGRVKQIEVTGLFFRVKRALDGQRADVLGAGENGLAAGLLKAEIQRSLPAFLSGGNTVPCNVAPLQNQDKTAAMSIDRRSLSRSYETLMSSVTRSVATARGESGITAPDYSPG